ncbi:exo-alpha-sialidase [Undibacterium sp. Di26W]|uniref:exo-alpha-sialidase n=1 Tax=Undibacterium sp. Di26W TaxID=3413035 RepID=UPI003BEFC87A
MKTVLVYIHRYLGLLFVIAACNIANAQSYHWNSVAIGGGGFVSGIITSKTEQGLIYARTDVGGAYRWDKLHSRWIPLTDWVSDQETGLLGIESIAIDPTATNKVYLLAGISYLNGGRSAILKSSDYGQTFTKIDVSRQFKVNGNGMGRNTGEKLQVDPANGNILYAGTRANGIFKSVDGGLSWEHLANLDVNTTSNRNGISFVVLDPHSISDKATQRLFLGVSRYALAGDNLYMSADAGQTFTAVTGGPTALMPHRAVIADDDLIITYANGAGPWGDSRNSEGMDQGQVWKYKISTGNWTNITPRLNRAYAGISVDPNNSSRIIVSTINYFQSGGRGDKIFLTTDGGKTWIDIYARGFTLDTNGIAWIKANSIHWAGSIEFDPYDTKTVMVVSGNGVFKTSNIDAVPATWKFNVANLEETVPLNLISIPGGPIISAIGDYDGFRHSDVAQYATINAPTMGTTTGLAFATQATHVIVRVGSAMYISTDMGISWTKTASMNGKNGQVAISADGKVILHSPEGSTTSYYSTDSGTSWTVIAGLDISNARPVADAVNGNKFYALHGDRLLVSTNAGISFSEVARISSGKSSKLMRAAPGREGDIWLPLYDGGLARATDSGASIAYLNNVSYAAAVGFGKAAAGSNYPTVYIWGTVAGTRGLFCSKDVGASWVRINDDAHQYGGPGDGQFVVGDMNKFGTVYMSTAGRGIVFGTPVTGQDGC